VYGTAVPVGESRAPRPRRTSQL